MAKKKASAKPEAPEGVVFSLAMKLAAQLDALLDSDALKEHKLKPKDITGAIKDLNDIFSGKDGEAQNVEIVLRIEGGYAAWGE